MHVAGQLDELVAGFSRTNSKLADLRNSVRTVCNRWSSEQLSQQQQLWKLQQTAADLQRTVSSKSRSSSPHHGNSAPQPFKSNDTPTRNVFAEVQLNGQSSPVHEHDPKVGASTPPCCHIVLCSPADHSVVLFGRRFTLPPTHAYGCS